MEAASAPHSASITSEPPIAVDRPGAAIEPAGDRRPVDGLTACAGCGRFPLVGERLTHRGGGSGGGWLCDGCEVSGRGERLGAVDGVDRVRSLAGTRNVRRIG